MYKRQNTLILLTLLKKYYFTLSRFFVVNTGLHFDYIVNSLKHLSWLFQASTIVSVLSPWWISADWADVIVMSSFRLSFTLNLHDGYNHSLTLLTCSYILLMQIKHFSWLFYASTNLTCYCHGDVLATGTETMQILRMCVWLHVIVLCLLLYNRLVSYVF